MRVLNIIHEQYQTVAAQNMSSRNKFMMLVLETLIRSSDWCMQTCNSAIVSKSNLLFLF